MESRTINVHYLPRHVDQHALARSVVVVIDVLRATTTICQALASGATEVVPFLEIEETLAAAEQFGRANVVLGGERKGKRIEGFDLGNSPSEYAPERVRGKRVLITTTNGTRALAHAKEARRVLVGALVNLSALVASLQDEPRIDILCAGTDGKETGEDILAAGAMVDQMCQQSSVTWQLKEAADNARCDWKMAVERAQTAGRSLAEQLAIELRETPGGRNLLGIGLHADLVDCAQLDRLRVIPELDISAWQIR